MDCTSEQPECGQNEFQRFAAIDIGTVTCRLLVAQCNGVEVRPLAKRAVITNLGEEVDATGVLKPEAMERVFSTVRDFLEVIKSFEDNATAMLLVAMATSAARDAQNAADFAAGLAAMGVTLSIIPGEKEAALSFMGASASFAGQPIIVTDIGGGSTEVIAGTAGQAPVFAHSFNIGCRRMTERFLSCDPLNAAEVEAARAWTREQLQPYFRQIQQAGFSGARIVSVAGTATSIVSMKERMEVYDPQRVHGAVVTKDELDQLFCELSQLSLEQRMHRVGLQPQRASVINAGLIIQQEVLCAAGVSSFTASETDILHGIILSAFASKHA